MFSEFHRGSALHMIFRSADGLLLQEMWGLHTYQLRVHFNQSFRFPSFWMIPYELDFTPDTKRELGYCNLIPYWVCFIVRCCSFLDCHTNKTREWIN